MKELTVKDGKFSYIEAGQGPSIVILHGLMGGLSNFKEVITHFSSKGYRVIVPELPLYSLPLLKTSVKGLVEFLHDFIQHKDLDQVILLGNSLGGHVGLLFNKMYPQYVRALVLTGSSGLYENAMGAGYPRRGDYEFVKKKSQEVFYNPEVATQEIVDEVFSVINDRMKLVKTLAISKSAIRHNMAKDLPHFLLPVCLIWGKNDRVTPPEVAEEFHKLLPNSSLFWIDKCGHAPMMEHPSEFNLLLEKWLVTHQL